MVGELGPSIASPHTRVDDQNRCRQRETRIRRYSGGSRMGVNPEREKRRYLVVRGLFRDVQAVLRGEGGDGPLECLAESVEASGVRVCVVRNCVCTAGSRGRD
jgi:hypothetical protein